MIGKTYCGTNILFEDNTNVESYCSAIGYPSVGHNRMELIIAAYKKIEVQRKICSPQFRCSGRTNNVSFQSNFPPLFLDLEHWDLFFSEGVYVCVQNGSKIINDLEEATIT